MIFLEKTAHFTFLRHEQPSEEAWAGLRLFAETWNKDHDPRLVDTMDFLLSIKFSNQSAPTFSQFEAALEQEKASRPIRYHVTSERVFYESDYREADFVEIVGVGLDGLFKGPFVLNASEALGPAVPCRTCGWQDIFNMPQLRPFAVDEALLDLPLVDGERNPTGGWDCVNLPNGHKLVSSRLVQTLEKGAVGRYELLPVLSGTSGRESERVFQLRAGRAILRLRFPENGQVDSAFCQSCGAVSSLQSGANVSLLEQSPNRCVGNHDLNGEELFSRHADRGAMLYVARRVYQLLLDAQLNGVVANDAIKVCPQRTSVRANDAPG